MNPTRRKFLIAVAAVLGVALFLALLVPQARIGIVQRTVLAQLGKPYVFGKAGPDVFDCSGLMCYAFAKVGVELAHYTKTVANDDQYQTIDDPAKLRRGDLVFFDTISGGSQIDHVGFWLDRNRFVHASSAAGKVIVSAFDERWQKRFTWAKRIL